MRLNPLVNDELVGIGQAGLDIRWLQPGITLKDGFRCFIGCQHVRTFSTDRNGPRIIGVPLESLEFTVIHLRRPCSPIISLACNPMISRALEEEIFTLRLAPHVTSAPGHLKEQQIGQQF